MAYCQLASIATLLMTSNEDDATWTLIPEYFPMYFMNRAISELRGPKNKLHLRLLGMFCSHRLELQLQMQRLVAKDHG
jgi:hypothetical protein